MTDTRDLFERTFKLTMRQAWRTKDGTGYQNTETQAKWEGWQRALETVRATPETTSYVQPVPDKCDRIVWRGNYYHLPIAATPAPTAPSDLRSILQEIVQSAIAPGRASAAESYITPHLLHKAEQALAAATPAPSAPSERKPVAWACWMNFDGEMRPTDPVFFTEEGAQRQQATYGGEIVPLYR